MKKWYLRSFAGGIKGPEMRGKALRRALVFLNQNSLKPEEVKITEGWAVQPPYSSQYEGGVYEVTVFYFAEGPLDYQESTDL